MPRFSRPELEAAAAASRSSSDVLRRLGLRPAGGNHATLRKYFSLWGISTDHFDPAAARRAALGRTPVPLAEVLVEGSSYSRASLKRRLLADGLKEPRCELCGQTATWRGRQMALVLDHINGVADDNRLENLRILCPNCNATLDTHCGRHNRRRHAERSCATCEARFRPRTAAQRYCSRSCAGKGEGSRVAHLALRRVERPSFDVLLRDVAELGYLGTGRKYGVSDNAIRKWMRAVA
jgi:HNH endonuclease